MRISRLPIALVLTPLLAVSPGFTGERARPAPEERPGVDGGSPSERAERRLPDTPYGLRQAGYDASYLARRPFDLGPRGRRKVYAVAASTLFLYLVRDEIRERVQERRTESRSDFLNDVRTMGKGGFAPSLALLAYGASFATGNDRERETALLLLESAGYSAATAYAGSFVLAAERPEEGDSIHFLDVDGHGVSLDAALAASVIPPLRRQYLRVRPEDGRGKRFWKRSATVLLYAGALLTAYQRLDADEHWAPDVFLGTTAGLSVGKTLCDAHDDVRTRKVRLSWGLHGSGAGLTLTIDLDRGRVSP